MTSDHSPAEPRIEILRRQLAELASTIRKLDQSSLGTARAQFLLLRKQVELEDVMKRGADATRSAPMV